MSDISFKNYSRYLGKKRDVDFYAWCIFFDGPKDVLSEILAVEYVLDPTFPDPVRRVMSRDSLFALHAVGWGDFDVGIRVIFKSGKSQRSKYRLKLVKGNWPTDLRSESLSPLEEAEESLFGADRRSVRLEERWRLANRDEVRLRNHIGPAYMLDETYHFLDWNPVFDDLIARDLKLHRGMHAQSFVHALANRDVVIPRAQKQFSEHGEPLVDLEPLVFDSKRFGRIEFQKIASRILDERGDTLLWIVMLNISGVEQQHSADLWKEVHETLVDVANWTACAASYDNLMSNFDEYGELLGEIVSRVGDADRCIDLGTGTGNTALKLLEKPGRLVWAVENNEAMLRCLDNKILREDAFGMADRLFISKANINYLGEFQSGFFDAATMTNVLYAVDDPLTCLKETNRLLKIGGTLVLSTSTNETDINKLFDAMRARLQAKDVFQDLRKAWTDAKAMYQRMDTKIHRDTKEGIRGYLKEAGFEIDEQAWLDTTYADAVFVAKATKTREAF